MVQSQSLSRRERQILEIVVRLSRATVGDVRDEIDDPPSYSAVRTTMGILVDKGHLKFERDGRRYVYRPAQSPGKLKKRALKDLVKNFFNGSAEELVDTLLDPATRRLDPAELDRIAEIVEQARERRS